MFDGTLKNTFVANTPLARLAVGITARDGTRAELNFVRDDATGDLVAQVETQVISGAEVDGSDAQDPFVGPTEDELNEMYLVAHAWQRGGRNQVDGLSDLWEDPLTGGCYFFANALVIQEGRDLWGEQMLGEQGETSC